MPSPTGTFPPTQSQQLNFLSSSPGVGLKGGWERECEDEEKMPYLLANQIVPAQNSILIRNDTKRFPTPSLQESAETGTTLP